MVNHEHKFIFIHVPRTGGTSIESQFQYNDLSEKTKHWNLNDWKDHLSSREFNSYFKFTFIRNPWDIMISKYRAPYFSTERRGGLIGERAGKSLKYFLMHYKTPLHEHGETFHDYFDPVQVNYIGRYENRKNDLKYISTRIGITIDNEPHMNKIQMHPSIDCKHYTEYYDDETRDIIAQKYARDIEYFGYKFS